MITHATQLQRRSIVVRHGQYRVIQFCAFSILISYSWLPPHRVFSYNRQLRSEVWQVDIHVMKSTMESKQKCSFPAREVA